MNMINLSLTIPNQDSIFLFSRVLL